MTVVIRVSMRPLSASIVRARLTVVSAKSFAFVVCHVLLHPIAVASLALAYVMFASLIFALVYRHAIRTGPIARYSAESVS